MNRGDKLKVNFPDDFFSFHNGGHISKDEVNKWIEDMLEKMKKKNLNSYSRSTGNTMVCITKHEEDNEFRIIVSQGYWEKHIPIKSKFD